MSVVLVLFPLSRGKPTTSIYVIGNLPSLNQYTYSAVNMHNSLNPVYAHFITSNMIVTPSTKNSRLETSTSSVNNQIYQLLLYGLF